MIFDINTTSDISKLLYLILRAVRRVKFETILKYHVRIMLLFVYTTTLRRFVIFTCRYFKLSWNTTALSQSNYRNFSCSSITKITLKQLSKKHNSRNTVSLLKPTVNSVKALLKRLKSITYEWYRKLPPFSLGPGSLKAE